MWFMNEAKGIERSVEGLVRRMLLVNFSSIHTTSIVSITTLFEPCIASLITHGADVHTSLVPPSGQP